MGLIKKIKNRIGYLFSAKKHSTRNAVFLYNTILNLFLKGGVFIINFLTIPLLLNLLSKYNFGIWEIAFTIISYALILNFGLGNSLRNLISLNLVKNRKQKINHLISITFLISIGLSFIFLIFFVLASILLKSKLSNLSEEVFWFLIITVFSFLINIVLSLFSSISNAFQKSYLISVYSFIQSFVFIISLLIITHFKAKNTLVLIGLSFNISTIITNVILGIHLYKTNKWLKFQFPSRYFKKYSLFIFNIGKQFALVQLATLFLFSADSIIIGAVYKVESISSYSVVNKLFFYIITIFSIFLIQLWNSTTHAFASKDFKWINTIKRRLEILIIPVIAVIILINIFSQQLFGIWVGKDFQVNKTIVFLLGIYTIFHIWNAIYVNILNGMGALKQQLFLYLLGNILLVGMTLIIYYFKLNIEYFVLSKTIIIIIISLGMYKSYLKEMKNA